LDEFQSLDEICIIEERIIIASSAFVNRLDQERVSSEIFLVAGGLVRKGTIFAVWL
jgi:hypothetical protein